MNAKATPTPKPPTLDEIKERAYLEGARLALANVMMFAIREMMPGDERTNLQRLAVLVAERERAVAMLRRVCEEFGDNDWPDTLDLSDIIEKHLARSIAELVQPPPAGRVVEGTGASPEKPKR